MQQRCHPDIEGIRSLASISTRGHPDIRGIQGLASISSRGVTQTLEEYKGLASISSRGVTRTLEEYKAWPAQGLASKSSRGVTQTLKEYKTWPAYPAEVSPRQWRNTRPGQHIQQRHHPDIGAMQSLARLRYTGHIEEILSLASIVSRGVTQTLEQCKAWPGSDILDILKKGTLQ